MFTRADLFILAAALLSFLLSVYLWFSGEKEAGKFVGIWVPSVLGLGIYVKLMGRGGRHV